MVTFKGLKSGGERVCVVGLGYVGLPLAVALAKHFKIVGLDVNQKRIESLKRSIDHTKEISSQILKKTKIEYSFDPAVISTCKFIIIAVPTPVTEDNIPDMSLVEKATTMVAKYMQPGTIIAYESTVYPGATEEICLPIIEKISRLKLGGGFALAYSPERINPGDKEHTINKITKIVSASDDNSLEVVAKVYGSITKIFKASSIKVAEAAKVIENTQRDINIALMNELVKIFAKMDINTFEVIAAAKTKWNFLPFYPGLVGGHCIGVDPYYLTFKSQSLGYEPEVLLAGRKLNDSMAYWLVDEYRKKMNGSINKQRILILGFTFKENIPDIRNTKVWDMVKSLKGFGAEVDVFDPVADTAEVMVEYGFNLTQKLASQYDAVFLMVPHAHFKKDLNKFVKLVKKDGYLLDLKNMFDKQKFKKLPVRLWQV